MANAKFGRVITAMITPFTADGEVDYEGAVTLAKHLVEHGSEGILVGGTTGEGATMTAYEKLKLFLMLRITERSILTASVSYSAIYFV